MTLLENSLLRRLAAPLRQRVPRLYRTLNSLRGRLIRGTSQLAPYQALALHSFRERCLLPHPGSYDVLEIGSDLGLGVLDEIAGLGVRSIVGVNPSPELWDGRTETELRSPRGGRLLKGDTRGLSFPDGSFDRIFSIAALEHILDFPVALREMYRVLRPGGMVYASFGPIWSSGKGHHVKAEADGRQLRHANPELNPIPDFAHLLSTPEEMRAAIARSHGAPLAAAAVAWIWGSTELNRMFFHEYEQAFRASPFKLVSLIPAIDPVAPQLARILAFRFPTETRFDVTNAEVVLERLA